MKFIKACSLLFFVSITSLSAEARQFSCSNQPMNRWGNFYLINADLTTDNKLEVEIFGLFQGSITSEEMEPISVRESFATFTNISLKASSREWKDALSFDLSNNEFGNVTFYIHSKNLNPDSKSFKARLKLKEKSILLNCN